MTLSEDCSPEHMDWPVIDYFLAQFGYYKIPSKFITSPIFDRSDIQ